MSGIEYSEAERALIESSEESGYLLRLARTGIEMEVFQRTPAGAHLHARAMEDLEQATQKLLACETLDDEKAVKAHADARTALAVIRYMAEAIRDGETAADELGRLDQEDSNE